MFPFKRTLNTKGIYLDTVRLWHKLQITNRYWRRKHCVDIGLGNKRMNKEIYTLNNETNVS